MSPDARFVAYGYGRVEEGKAEGVCVWKLDGPEPALLLDVPEGMYGHALAFRPNGRQLAIGHADKSVSVYDLATGQRVQRLADSVTAVHLAFHPATAAWRWRAGTPACNSSTRTPGRNCPRCATRQGLLHVLRGLAPRRPPPGGWHVTIARFTSGTRRPPPK